MQKFKTAPTKNEHFELKDLGIDYTLLLQSNGNNS